MGRAARWLRGIFGGKKAAAAAVEPREKKQRWGSFVKSFREKERRGEAAPAPAVSYGGDEEQSKHAIAVAAATAAVAEAAVAAAHAAAAVVRLTSSGRAGTGGGGGGGKREVQAAVKIQAAFRAYLARRALRALKGLVKLQALVRGNIVRKNTADTMRSMQALVRVQARARACRALRSDRSQLRSSSRSHPGPSTPEKSEQPVRSNSRKPERSSTLKRNSSKQTSSNDRFNQHQAESSGLQWLDQWMEDRYSMVPVSTPLEDERNAKILEIDTGKPSKRKIANYPRSSCSPLTSDQYSQSFTTVPDSPSRDSTVALRSIPSPSSVDMNESITPLRFPILDGCDYGDSPQFFSASSRPGSSRRGPFTPAKSDCSRSLFSGYSDYPNYMANTESSRAKVQVRSQSAPKQRPEFEKSGSMRRVSGGNGPGLCQLGQTSSSLHAKFANKGYPGSGRLDRLGMPLRI